MMWNVAYGSGRSLRAPGPQQEGSGWTIRRFETEEEALDFATARVEEGLVVQFVSKDGEDPKNPRYRHADIVALRADD
jgi:hypothetical protein